MDRPEISDDKRELSANDVRLAYRYLLGREAENEVVIEQALKACRDFQALRMKFINSTEFRNKATLPPPSTHKPLDWPHIAVETDVSPVLLERMLRHIESNWQAMGESEPHFSVLTHPGYRADKIDQNLDMFYDSGVQTASYFSAAALRSNVKLNPAGRCFELGCGVGRVTLALSKLFEHVVGGDISRAHLRHAEKTAQDRSAHNIEFVHLQSVNDIYSIPQFDYFFSVIVLQHNPPPVINALLGTILNRMSPGGLAYFQVPTYRLGYDFKAEPYLASASTNGQMEVHVLPQWRVFELARSAKCEILEVREDGWTGNQMYVSNSFLLSKPADQRS